MTKSKNSAYFENKKTIAVSLAISVSILIYLAFGIVTSIIPNKFFTRMTSVGWLEHASLLITSLLIGIYIGITYYVKATNKDGVCNTTATAGGVFGFLTFGCSICNKILVFFLGITGVLTYFEPIRPFLGIVSILFLGFAIYKKAENITAS